MVVFVEMHIISQSLAEKRVGVLSISPGLWYYIRVCMQEREF